MSNANVTVDGVAVIALQVATILASSGSRLSDPCAVAVRGSTGPSTRDDVDVQRTAPRSQLGVLQRIAA